MIMILCLILASFGIGAMSAGIVITIKDRNNVPAWAKTRNAAGRFIGRDKR